MTEERLKHLPAALRREGHDGPTCGVKGHIDHASIDLVTTLCNCGEELAIEWRALVRAENCICDQGDEGVVCWGCWACYARAKDEGSCLGHHLCGRRDGHRGPCMAQVIEGRRDDRRLRVVLCEPPAPPVSRVSHEELWLQLAGKIVDLARKTKESGPSSVAAAPAARPRLTIACQGDWE